MLDQYNSEWLEALKTDESTLEYRQSSLRFRHEVDLFSQEFDLDYWTKQTAWYAILDDENNLYGSVCCDSSDMPGDILEAYLESIGWWIEYDAYAMGYRYICRSLEIKTVKDIPEMINGESVLFAVDSQDIEGYKQDFDPYDEYGSFFVCSYNGDIIALWGMWGIIPEYHKTVERLV